MLFVESEAEPAPRPSAFEIMEKVAQISGRASPTGSRDKILVLHSIPNRDIQAEEIVAELARRGAPVYFFHTNDFLQACRLSIEFDPSNRISGMLELPAGDLALEEIKSVWFRGPKIAVGGFPDETEGYSGFVQRETEASLFGMLGALEQAFWVNHPDAVHAAEDKLAQLRLAQSCGLIIPRTLVTNDPQRVLDFYDGCRGEVIIKTFRRLAFFEDGLQRLILTNRLLSEHLDQVDLVKNSPCMFQEYVPKKYELRLTVVGRQIFAAEIHSQNAAASRDDYRRYDFANTPYFPHTLPKEVEAACLATVQQYGLAFAAIDLIRRPDGAYVFLEMNANAQFLWIQDLTGMPIREALVDLLIQGSCSG